MTPILKKLRCLPVFGLLAAAALLSVVLGCGGSSGADSARNSSFSVDISDNSGAGGTKSSVAITVRNASATRFIQQVTFIKTDGTQVIQSFSPTIPPGGAAAGVVLYTTPLGNFLGAVTAAVTASDTTGRFSQGYNMTISFDRNGNVTLNPPDGIFYFQ